MQLGIAFLSHIAGAPVIALAIETPSGIRSSPSASQVVIARAHTLSLPCAVCDVHPTAAQQVQQLLLRAQQVCPRRTQVRA